jgi:hypothetical protein
MRLFPGKSALFMPLCRRQGVLSWKMIARHHSKMHPGPSAGTKQPGQAYTGAERPGGWALSTILRLFLNFDTPLRGSPFPSLVLSSRTPKEYTPSGANGAGRRPLGVSGQNKV